MTGRDRRLLAEWDDIRRQFGCRKDVIPVPKVFNEAGMPVRYEVEYLVHSICGVERQET